MKMLLAPQGWIDFGRFSYDALWEIAERNQMSRPADRIHITEQSRRHLISQISDRLLHNDAADTRLLLLNIQEIAQIYGVDDAISLDIASPVRIT
jgi:hypothetical protein